MRISKTLTAALVALTLSAAASARAAPSSSEVQFSRLLQALTADLLGHDSATAVLQRWCDAYGPGGGARITAERVRDADKPLPDAGQAALGAGSVQGVRYRRVRLACAGRVLSEADNWYLPSRLTPQMNAALDSTDTPFGVVVRLLDFHRRNLTSRPLYDGAGAAQPPPQVLENSAVLSTAAGDPFSYVVETYTGDALAMAASAPAH
jgi:chorismate-pyruvate lyase